MTVIFVSLFISIPTDAVDDCCRNINATNPPWSQLQLLNCPNYPSVQCWMKTRIVTAQADCYESDPCPTRELSDCLAYQGSNV